MDNKPFNYIEDIAIADIAVEAYGKTLEKAFENIGKGVMNIISDISKINKNVSIDIDIKSEDLKSLLYDFINEILYHMDSKSLIFSDVNVIEIKNIQNGYLLKAEIFGQKMDKNIPIKCEVKAPTYHEMLIKKVSSGKYYIRMVVDI